MEQWRNIPLYNSEYQASSEGRIKRKKGVNVIGRPIRERIRKTVIQKRYERVILSSGVIENYAVHVLVALAFFGFPENGLWDGKTGTQVNHKDGNSLNNKVSNLEWISEEGNRQHAKINGLLPKGMKNKSAKLTDDNVIEIRNLYKTGFFSQRDLSKKFLVSQSQIWCVINRITWTHIN